MQKHYLALLRETGFSGADGPYLGGILTEGDLRFRTIDGVPYAMLWNEFEDTLSLWNAHQAGVASIFTYPVQSLVEMVPSVGQLKFERASEFGIPKSARAEVNYYQLAYGYNDYDMRIAYTWKFLRENPAEQIRAIHGRALEAHQLEVMDMVFSAIFDNRTRDADINGLPYKVYPLYNGEGPKPPDYNGTTFNTNHSHYLVSGGALLDSDDIESCKRLLEEHGYGFRSGTQIIAMANLAEIDVIRTFRVGVVNNQSKVAKYDWIPARNQPARFTPNADGLLGTQPPDYWNGLVVQGSYGDVWFVDEPTIPPGYILFFATGGVANVGNLVGIREHENPGWRGLRLMPGNQSNYPLIDGFYQFGAGTGIRNRGGAVVLQVKASGSYDIPANFTHDTLT
jgi:hypothetical protein